MATSKNTSTGEEVIVLVTVEVKPEKLEEFENVLGISIVNTRQEKGVIAYNVYKVQTKPNHYLIVEKYASKAVLDNHLQQAYFLDLKHMLEGALVNPLDESINFGSELTPA